MGLLGIGFDASCIVEYAMNKSEKSEYGYDFCSRRVAGHAMARTHQKPPQAARAAYSRNRRPVRQHVQSGGLSWGVPVRGFEVDNRNGTYPWRAAVGSHSAWGGINGICPHSA